VLASQRVEHHHLVDAVDELGAEVLAHDFHHRGLHPCVVLLAGELLDELRAQVRGHDDHGVAEVHRAALAVGEAAVVEHCSSTLNTSGCAFSTSSSRITLYGRRRTASVR